MLFANQKKFITLLCLVFFVAGSYFIASATFYVYPSPSSSTVAFFLATSERDFEADWDFDATEAQNFLNNDASNLGAFQSLRFVMKDLFSGLFFAISILLGMVFSVFHLLNFPTLTPPGHFAPFLAAGFLNLLLIIIVFVILIRYPYPAKKQTSPSLSIPTPANVPPLQMPIPFSPLPKNESANLDGTEKRMEEVLEGQMHMELFISANEEKQERLAEQNESVN